MSFIALPAELIAHIFTYLDDQSLFSTRLGHRNLEKCSFSYFAKRFFRKKGFLITTSSLGTLQSIARHVELRQYVQHLWFNPDCFTYKPPDCCPDDEDEASVPQDAHTQRQYLAYQECMRDHEYLLSDWNPWPSPFELLITSVFHCLPNLVTIGMRRSESHNPHGWSELYKAIGQDPRLVGHMPPIPRYFLSTTTNLFVALISAVAKAGVKLQRLYTDAVELDHIDPEALSPSKLIIACESILYVELNVVKARIAADASTVSRLARDDVLDGENLVRLLKTMPNLKEIGLQILLEQRDRRIASVSKSYPYRTFQRLTRDVSFPHLARIKLEGIKTSAGILQNFLTSNAERLTSLKLRDVLIFAHPGQSSRSWGPLFRFLATQCAELGYILFYHLMHNTGTVSFVEEEPEARPDDGVDEVVVGQAVFEKYSHITLEVKGKDDVRQKLEEVAEKHWYHQPLFSYAMDEDLWHTDTSDEEW